ncbi:MAG: glycosyltransferase family 39 protein [Chloroflexia bacterium]
MIIARDNANSQQATGTSIMTSRLEMARILSWSGLALPLTISALLNMWNLAQNGYSNLYYSVAVQSMTQNFRSFFYAAYDPGGFITVDKPPVALWIQAISAKIFGFSSLSILLPQAIAGVVSVGILYLLVRRLFGGFAGFVAALALAITPIAVAVERTNNTDTFLMLTTLLAAWALTLATEKGKLSILLLGLGLVGVAFNIKMLAAFIILPAFYLLYFVAAPIKWHMRIVHLAVASLVLFGVALSWPLAVDLTPASARPWVGGSQANSVLDLALNYNGLGRVTGNEGVGGGGFGGRSGPRQPNVNPGNGTGIPGATFPGGTNRGNRGGGNRGQFPQDGQNGINPGGILPLIGNIGRGFAGGGLFGAGEPGATRLFTGLMAGQWSWLFPLALIGVVAALFGIRKWWPLERKGQAILLWSGWLAVYGVVFSIASGIFHPYYLIMLGPPTAALVGIGVSSLWTSYRRDGWQAWLLPVALLATAFWQSKVLADYTVWSAWLTPVLFAGSAVAAVGLVVTRLLAKRIDGRWRRWAMAPLAVGMLALLVSPAAWAVTPVLAGPSNASLPTSGPEALNQNDPSSWTRLNDTSNDGLIKYLKENQDGYYYLLVVANSQQASSIALKTDLPVMSAGGFMGTDPTLTAEKLADLVATKQVRFVMGLDSGRNGSSVGSWIQTNCSTVGASAYGGETSFSGAFGLGNSSLYDCAAP